MASIKLHFHGGVGTVTGANFLLETGKLKILVDCGLVQGVADADAINKTAFPYDPASIDILFVTHAHMDHIGRIPKLVKDGFRGIIYSTPETQALSEVMLDDAVGLLTREASEKGEAPLYEKKDVDAAFSLWKNVPYHTTLPLGDALQVYFRDAGHILGSAMVEFRRNGKRLVCTGDLGNTPTPLLRDTESLEDPTYIVTESVYGNRNHENRSERRQKFADAINESTNKGGTLLIPSFSLEKTQVLLHELNDLLMEQQVRKVPIYLDSPLAASVTNIYRRMSENFNDATKAQIKSGDDPFDFPGLKIISDKRESEAIERTPNPKIIIAGSGMSTGGRVVRHERDLISNPNNTILFVGYQSIGTLGRQISEGTKYVEIMGESVPVRANIVTVSGYSSHKDSDHIVEFIEPYVKTLKKVFVVMGEPKASLFLVQKLKDYAGIEAYHPEQDEVALLDM